MREIVSPLSGIRSPFFGRRAFSPAALFAAGEQGVWYDPSDFSTLFQDDAGTTPVTAVGQAVGRILDKSGRGNHATQSTPGARPLLQQEAGGQYYLAFDGTDDQMSTASINPGSIDKMQLFFGALTASTANQGVMQFGSFAGSMNALLLTGASPPIRSSVEGNSGNVSQMRISGPTTSTRMVVTQTYDIAGATMADESQIRLNGTLPSQTQQGTGPAGGGNFGSQVLTLGTLISTFFLHGRLYSLVARFGAPLTAAEIAQTEAWVNGKTGAY
jgi:hypothetical protein